MMPFDLMWDPQMNLTPFRFSEVYTRSGVYYEGKKGAFEKAPYERIRLMPEAGIKIYTSDADHYGSVAETVLEEAFPGKGESIFAWLKSDHLSGGLRVRDMEEVKRGFETTRADDRSKYSVILRKIDFEKLKTLLEHFQAEDDEKVKLRWLESLMKQDPQNMDGYRHRLEYLGLRMAAEDEPVLDDDLDLWLRRWSLADLDPEEQRERREKLELGKKYFRELLAFNPDHLSARMALGYADYAEGKFKDAIGHFEKIKKFVEDGSRREEAKYFLPGIYLELSRAYDASGDKTQGKKYQGASEKMRNELEKAGKARSETRLPARDWRDIAQQFVGPVGLNSA
jgi:tetratricopeptide (TPR) repeat protein